MDAAQLFTPVAGMTLADAAQHYAASGTPVFPCAPGGKRPILPHGFHEASIDLDQVTGWWRRWPTANIGIPTGPASGIEVVDVDVKGAGPRGPDSWHRATRAGLLTGWAVHIVTPSGGLHAVHPTGTVEQRSWASGTAQIDFRGTGGYVIAPPSRTAIDGATATYRLLEVSPSPATPVDAARLRDFLDPRPVRDFGPARPFQGTARERTERLAAWLHAQGEGQRNQGLFWASCRLVEDGIGYHDAVQALGPVAESIGLPPREILRTIQSAYRTTQPGPAAHSSSVTSSRRLSPGRDRTSPGERAIA
ncbi:bifunctional DNA primase/polymerase [Microbacterium lacticum]